MTSSFRERRQRKPGDKPVFNLVLQERLQVVNIDGAFTLAFNAKMARLLLDAIDASGDDLNAALFSLAEKLEDGVKWADKFKTERAERREASEEDQRRGDARIEPADESESPELEASEGDNEMLDGQQVAELFQAAAETDADETEDGLTGHPEPESKAV